MDSGTLYALTFFGVLALFAIAFLIYQFSPGPRKRRAEREAARLAELARRQAEEQAAIANAEATARLFESNPSPDQVQSLNDHVVGVILQPGEKCCAAVGGVQHIGFAKHTRYVGGSHGVSVPIVKGVRYRVGAFKGHAETSVSEVVKDVGNLYVTNNRVVLAGSGEVAAVPINKVAEVRAEDGRVVILSENKPAPTIFLMPKPWLARPVAAAIRFCASNYSQPRKAS